jgi:hypothetical protein
LVGDVDCDDGGREREVVREEDVEGNAGDEVLVRVEGSFIGAFTNVAKDDFAVRRGGGSEGHVEDEVARQGEAEDVKAGSNVGGRGGNANEPLTGGKSKVSEVETKETTKGWLTLRSPAGEEARVEAMAAT